MGRKKNTSKTYKKVVTINVTEDQSELMNELGGPTEALREWYAFWYRNYDQWHSEKVKVLAIKAKMATLGVK